MLQPYRSTERPARQPKPTLKVAEEIVATHNYLCYAAPQQKLINHPSHVTTQGKTAMYNTELFEEFVAKSSAYTAPLVKANKLFIANLEKLAAFQMSLLHAYSDFGLARLKAATEVSDLESLKSFGEAQVEAATVLRQKLIDDGKALTALVASFKGEFETLAAESGVALTPKAVVAAPKSSRKTAAAA